MPLFPPKKPVVEAPPPPPPPPAAAMSKDEVKELLAGAMQGVAQELGATVRQLGERVEQLAARQPQVVVQPATQTPQGIPGVSDADIDQAVLTGQGAAARIRQLVDRAVTENTQRIIREQIEPLRAYGVGTIGELTQRVTVGGLKHYQRFQKEIGEKLGQLTPEVRANPAVVEMVYNAVVGAHADELTREAGELAIRQAQEEANKPPTSAPGTGAGPGASRDRSDELPTVERVAGEAGLEALSHKGQGGQSADDFARGMGYADWADYQKQYNELLKAETAGNA